MKYLCLIYADEGQLDQAPADELEAVANQCVAHVEELRDSGHLLATERLDSISTATSVRTRHGKLVITDGPFVETREQLAGFYLIEATDLDEAIRIASAIPPGRYGGIEIRPVRELS